LATISVAAGMVALAACAPPGARASGVDAGVPAGAGREEYVAALADVEPIALEFGGLTGGPNTPTVAAYVEYGELVSDWSGGKVTFEFDFGGAKLSLDKMADGLGQGRMDMGTFVPAFQPSEWPVANLAANLGFLGSGSPIAGRLALLAARMDFAHGWEPLVEEMTEHGIVITMPIFQNNEARMHCVSETPLRSLDELAGKRIRVADSGQLRMAEALGMVPVSMVNAEMYQGLQRGVVDCAVNGVSAALTQGYYDVVNSWTLENNDLVWGQTGTAWASAGGPGKTCRCRSDSCSGTPFPS
jgi:TRAP-type C4-dicarboxylate transport system substrate-binding protein